MNSMRKRIAILALAITIILGLVLACGSSGGLLSRNEPTATPTKTPKPTFTITPTPTETPIPTNTPTPTSTATPTPLATNTPIVLTATPTETATNTPVPTNTSVPPTATRRPATRVPPTATRPPQPTNTPAPQFAFRGTITGGSANCGSTGIKGRIKTRTGTYYPGVTVAVWTDGWEGTVSNPANTGGAWDVLLGPQVRPGVWYAAVVRAESCQPKPGGGGYTAQCTERQSNVVSVTTTANCEGSGAVQWPEIEFQQN